MRVWKDAKNLLNEVYLVTKSFPKDELYNLTSQMRRAASSVKANIAEGQGRTTRKDQRHFTSIGYSSLIELINHFDTALDQNYISKETFCQLRVKADAIAGQLSSLKKTQERKISNHE